MSRIGPTMTEPRGPGRVCSALPIIENVLHIVGILFHAFEQPASVAISVTSSSYWHSCITWSLA